MGGVAGVARPNVIHEVHVLPDLRFGRQLRESRGVRREMREPRSVAPTPAVVMKLRRDASMVLESAGTIARGPNEICGLHLFPP